MNGDNRKTPEAFAVGKVAAFLGVCPNTVTKWCVDGSLPATKLPSGHHRVSRASLISFFLANGFLQQAKLLGHDPCYMMIGFEDIRSRIEQLGGASVIVGGDLFAMGMDLLDRLPQSVAVDFMLDRKLGLDIGWTLKRKRPQTKLIAVVGEDEASFVPNAHRMYDVVLTRPVIPEMILAAML